MAKIPFFVLFCTLFVPPHARYQLIISITSLIASSAEIKNFLIRNGSANIAFSNLLMKMVGKQMMVVQE
jgi:hypothetical protein